jgi:GT2 family glycosyltransferase
MSSPNATLTKTAAASGGSLSISIVVYRLNPAELALNLGTLRLACEQAALTDVALTLIDNSEQGVQANELRTLAERTGWPYATALSGHGNVGYGAGHNLAIHANGSAESFAHLVLNPDVELDANALRAGLATLSSVEVVLVGAVGRDARGNPGYLSKRMPSAWIFFLRGFAPAWLKRHFDERLAHYEYRDLPSDRVSDVILVSGAFMLCRTATLRVVGGFDERYFLHFEDLDLSLRLARLCAQRPALLPYAWLASNLTRQRPAYNLPPVSVNNKSTSCALQNVRPTSFAPSRSRRTSPCMPKARF